MKRKIILFGLVCCVLHMLPYYLSGQESLLEIIKLEESQKYIKRGSIDTAIQSLAMLISLYSLKKKWLLYSTCRLKIAELYTKKGDFAKSRIEAYSSLDSAYAHIDSKDTIYCRYYRIIGSLNLDWGRLKEAKKYLIKSLNHHRVCDNDPIDNLMLIYYELGSYHYHLKEYDSSVYYYTKSLEIITKLDDNKYLKYKSDNLQSLGIVYFLKGNIAKAEELFYKSYRLSKNVYKEDFDKLSVINMNLGMFYFRMNDYIRALDLLSQAETINKKLIIPNKIRLYAIYWNKGLCYLFLEENTYAIKYLELALDICKKLYPENPEYLYPLIMDLAYAYEKTGNNIKAKEYYNTCLNTTDLKLRVKVLVNIATIYQQHQDIDKAYYHLIKAKDISENLEIKDSILIAYCYRKIGEHLLINSDDRGIEYLTKSLSINTKSDNYKENIELIYYLKGKYYQENNELKLSLKYFTKAIKEITSFKYRNGNYTESEFNSSNFSPLMINILIEKSKSLFRLFITSNDRDYLISSIEIIELCMKYIFRLQSFYSDHETKLELTRKYDNIYEQAINACRLAFFKTGDSSFLYKAFDFSERNKSMNLLLTLKDEHAKKLGNIPDSLLKKERDIKLAKFIYNKSLYEESKHDTPDTNKIKYWNERILDLEWKYKELLTGFERDYPEYYSLKYNLSTASVQDLQHQLNKDEMLLEYTLGSDSIYIFCITPGKYELLAKPMDSSLVSGIFSLRQNLKLFDIQHYDIKDFRSFQECALRLYNTLIHPIGIEPHISNLFIIPDDELGYLSFDMLIQDERRGNKIDFRRLPFLIRKYNISYSPSASLMAYHQNNRNSLPLKGLLAFAPTYSTFLNYQHLESDRRNLPGAITEVNNIPSRYFGRKFLAEQATEAHFKQHASQYDILHLAMHTQINDEYPLTSILRFHPGNIGEEDNQLHTYEIFGLDLNSRMVVLSACSSGNGKLEKGEGINSLARAFLYAGTESIIMTLWDVEDGASKELITYFYEFLSKGHKKDKALRMAKIKYLDNCFYLKEGHPYFWSGYVVYGNNDPVVYPFLSLARIKSNPWWITIAMLFVISLLILWRKYRYYKRNHTSWKSQYIRKTSKKRSALSR
jgi:CHAT domain-containing protein/tetratricopeptide (TPR) repeat protein